jgi:hypothetical protein
LLRCSTRQSRIPQLHNLALRRLRRRRSLLDNGSRRSLLDLNNRSRSNLLDSGSRSNLLDLNNGSRSSLLSRGGSNLLNRSNDGLLYNSRDRITMVRHVIYLTTKKIFKNHEISK